MSVFDQGINGKKINNNTFQYAHSTKSYPNHAAHKDSLPDKVILKNGLSFTVQNINSQ